MSPYSNQPQSAPIAPPLWSSTGVPPLGSSSLGPPLGPPLRPELRRPSNAPPIAHSQQYLLYLAEIGENTAGLVHDMRGPLTVIINGLRLCHRMPLPQIARQRLALALDEAERLNRIVNDVITFARSARPTDFQWQALDPLPSPDQSSQTNSQPADTRPPRSK
ncbi:histidine kinase dimerization/phospho-acceptor domain-containing protein [Nodosilinea sp. AN01ver1]|uniref:histidine kinase dimerization/phospho-acceptor domain-containing protein n=1 Tax=Nodosilinea sp. AN01ver1 TaxID=3423362 RepID=UPI003D3163F9